MGLIKKKTAVRATEGGIKYICDICSADITATVGFLVPTLFQQRLTSCRYEYDAPKTYAETTTFAYLVSQKARHPANMILALTPIPSSSNIPSPYSLRTGALMKNYCCWKAPRRTAWARGRILQIISEGTDRKMKFAIIISGPTSRARSSPYPSAPAPETPHSQIRYHGKSSRRARSGG